MNREARIKSIAEDANLSVNKKVEEILSVHQEIENDTAEFHKLGCKAYETIRALLLGDNYENCHLDDILMCDCLLVESYQQTSETWRIAPLAQEVYDMLLGLCPKNAERLRMCAQVLGRISCCLQRTGHPRLVMQLLAMQLRYEKQHPESDKEEMEEIAENLFRLSLLTNCDTWLKTVENDVVELLGHDKMESIRRKPAVNHLAVDPVEYTEQWEKIIDEVEAHIGEELADEPRCMGFCFRYWALKKRILQEYGIEWRSPSQMNPHVMFD